MRLPLLLGLALVVACGLATASVHAGQTPRPIVMWHGMGDNCCSKHSMDMIAGIIKDHIPGVYIYSVMIGSSPAEDTAAGFFGNMNSQVATVCDHIANDPQLANGFNLLGFSQGGQLLRGVVERCAHKLPPMHNLITYGGQHQGVSEIPNCEPTSELCQNAAKLAGMGVYLPWIRDHIVQAQYFLDPFDYDAYLKYNQYMADINNQRAEKNPLYKANLLTLNKLILVRFNNDTIVIPRASEHFGRYALGTMDRIVPMTETPLYQEDWIGLQELNNSSRLLLLDTPGEHMQIDIDDFVNNVVKPYLDN
ncbi:salivary protein [Thecamonas trahens ATCC 50062]|uniref:Palmitoyl-protein thioesterase 1 n=1 Tax=Thecamonas trahens ATCC 50062 TaxID=461836 RepID=A0A0L0D210_THETB|nr:salivary protein [Thecamonas trahens ATCC 50062]KNC46389.1 salivary protein [Thecamonas trahens ATCC 50062]|eukprot:XP_013760682.1 salivary protein [Thecamonas trahens ATCC 50062]